MGWEGFLASSAGSGRWLCSPRLWEPHEGGKVFFLSAYVAAAAAGHRIGPRPQEPHEGGKALVCLADKMSAGNAAMRQRKKRSVCKRDRMSAGFGSCREVARPQPWRLL